MVQNRNWQCRVEESIARREASKSRKQNQTIRVAQKAVAKEFLAFMDKHQDLLARQMQGACVLNIWCDWPISIDLGSAQCEDILDTNIGNIDKVGSRRRAESFQEKRNRSNSFNEGKKGRKSSNSTNESTTRRNRSNSFNFEVSSSIKKGRSRQNSFDEVEVAPMLCHRHFFSGSCISENPRKNIHSCCWLHYSLDKTIGTILLAGKDDADKKFQKDQLKLSADAAATISRNGDNMDDREGGMHMLYYFFVPFFEEGGAIEGINNDKDAINISDRILQTLRETSCSTGDIVYVVFNNILLFDRYQGGMVMSEDEFLEKSIGRERRNRSNSFVEAKENSNSDVDLETTEQDLHVLPGPVLEYILTFLPDRAVTAMSAVCTAWHQEIGKSSPALWAHMLQRRNWPTPSTGTGLNSRDLFRNDFISHYQAVRIVNTMRKGLEMVTGIAKLQNSSEKYSKDMIFQSFLKRRGAPSQHCSNFCAGVKVWSPNRILAAYKIDCTLRLFEAVARTQQEDTGGHSLACREAVCLNVAPYQNSKKRSCKLISMDLDEEMIGCLFSILNEQQEIEYMLTILSREDYLCTVSRGESEGNISSVDGTVYTINVGDAVLNYLLSLEEVDHRLLRLYDFIWVDGGRTSDVCVDVSKNMIACGCGRFMVEVSIWIPASDVDDIDGDLLLLGKKLVLFSAVAASILWMGDSNHRIQTRQILDDSMLACLRKYDNDGKTTACSIAVASSWLPTISLVEILPTGDVCVDQPVEAAEWVRNEVLGGNWEISDIACGPVRPVVLTTSDIIVVDNLSCEGDFSTLRKSVISFYPRQAVHVAYSTLTLDFECETLKMKTIGFGHILLLCRVFNNKFELAQARDEPEQIDAVIVAIESRKIIQRFCLIEDLSLFDSELTNDIPIFFDTAGDTIGMGVWWKGIVLSGRDVSSLCAGFSSNEELQRNGKKKKNKQKPIKKQASRKDRFTRGLSMTG